MTDTDKINIVSSQVVFELSSFRMNARSKSSTLVVNSHVDSRLFKARRRSPTVHLRYRFMSGRHDVAWQPRSCNRLGSDLVYLDATGNVRRNEVWCFLAQKVNGFTCTICWVHLQGSAATKFRRGRKFNTIFVQRPQESLKSIHVWRFDKVMLNQKGCTFYDSQCRYNCWKSYFTSCEIVTSI